MSDGLAPIIFIPGLMGSIGGEMLGYKGGWGFGVAAWIYKPFIKELENLGYKLNKNLFVCYYDWRKNCEDIVGQFFLPLLEQVKDKHSQRRVDLLCHSMGGLVGRTYIQDRTYGYDIGNLVIFGTPNKGSVEAYYLWSTGKVMARAGQDNPLSKIIKSGYIWLITKILNIPLGKDNIDKLHENFQGLRDLLPTYDYGYVLCYEDKNNNYVYISTGNIKYKNNFVDYLNRNIDVLHSRIKNLYCFVGTNRETNKTLIVDKNTLFNNKDENILSSLGTKKGDGTVTVRSATVDFGNTFIMKQGHTGILINSIKYIAEIYDLDKIPVKKDIIELEERPLGIIFKKHVSIELKRDDEIIAKFIYSELITKYEFIIEEFGKDYMWIVFRDLPAGKYTLELSTDAKRDHDIFIVGTKVEEELTDKNVKKLEGDGIQFYFEI